MLHRRGVYEHHRRRAIRRALLFRPRRALALLLCPVLIVAAVVHGALLRGGRRTLTEEPPYACDPACQNLRWPLPNMHKLQPRPGSFLELRLFRLGQAERLPWVMRPTIELLQRVSVLLLPPRAVERLRDPAEVEQSAHRPPAEGVPPRIRVRERVFVLVPRHDRIEELWRALVQRHILVREVAHFDAHLLDVLDDFVRGEVDGDDFGGGG